MPFAHPVRRLDVRNKLAPPPRRQSFFARTSCKMCLSNARRSEVRSAIEHVFAGQKHRMGLLVRTIGMARARIKISMANLAYNSQRLA